METNKKQKQKRDEQCFRESRRMALDVDFVETIGEFRRYSRALYAAMMWAKDQEPKQVKQEELPWWQTISRK